MTIAPSGTRHVLYATLNATREFELRHARRAPGASWSVETVAAVGTLSRPVIRAVVDASETVHVSYEPEAAPAQGLLIGYAQRTPSGTWSLAPLEIASFGRLGQTGQGVLAADADGGVYVGVYRLGYAYGRFCP